MGVVNSLAVTYVSFIADDDFRRVVASVLEPVVEHTEHIDIHKNTIDPFTAVFDAMLQHITLDAWLKQEHARQRQKTLQNKIGDFHQRLIGKLADCQSLETGHIIDVHCSSKQVIAEIKNKFNTTKGNHKKQIYDDLAQALTSATYQDHVAYYVEIIPKAGHRYNDVFTPSDNLSGQSRPSNERIRRIDGYSFYALITDVPDALEQVYKALPRVISDVLDLPPEFTQRIYDDERIGDLFARAYHTNK